MDVATTAFPNAVAWYITISPAGASVSTGSATIEHLDSSLMKSLKGSECLAVTFEGNDLW